jgi:hypothetical protein
VVTPLKIDSPSGFKPEDEFPLEVLPEIPMWSENYWFVAFDASNQVGVWTHMGRTDWDLSLWREVAIVHLPSGDFVVSKNFGRQGSPIGASPSTLAFEFSEPWNRGAVRMDGAGVKVSREQANSGLIGEGRHGPLRLNLDWTAFGPVWGMRDSDLSEQSWGATRYEQLCEVSGTVACAGEEFEFNGTALRDHTRGPRDFLPVVKHACFSCTFPESGRGMHVLDVLVDDTNHHILRAAILDKGELHEAEVIRSTALVDSRDDVDGSYELELRWPGGQAVVHAQTVRNMPTGLAGLNEFILGLETEQSYNHCFEGFARFTWDGEVAYGLSERSIRHRATH